MEALALPMPTVLQHNPPSLTKIPTEQSAAGHCTVRATKPATFSQGGFLALNVCSRGVVVPKQPDLTPHYLETFSAHTHTHAFTPFQKRYAQLVTDSRSG